MAPLELPPVQTDATARLYDLPLSALIVPDAASHVRHARADDLELLTRWRVSYALETLNETETPQLWARARAAVAVYNGRRATVAA